MAIPSDNEVLTQGFANDKRQKHRWLRLVLSLAALFWLVCTGLVLLRYYNFYPTYAAFDQGIFDQVFWNSLHGRWFESSLSSTLSSSVVHDRQVPAVDYRRLGQHFTPALMLWLPYYALFSSPAGLSVLQVTIVTAAGLVLYALARHYHPPRLSTWLTASFYAANAVLGPTIANFHDLCQIPLYIFGLLLAMEKRWWWLFGVLTVLTLLVREDAGVVLFSIGTYLVLSRRYPRLGLAVCVLSFGYMLALTTWIMPLFSSDVSRRFTVEQFGQYVDGEEATTLQVIWGIISQPWRLLVELLTPLDRTIKYFLAQWLPLAFIPAVSPSAWVLAGFPLIKNMLSQDVTALSIDLRYAITIVPGLFYGAILWWAEHRDRFQPRLQRLWLLCLGVALVLTLISNPNRALSFAIPDSFQPWVYTAPSRQWQHVQVIRSFLRQIPADASVATTTYIVPHLSRRREIVRFPILRVRNDAQKVMQVEYALVDLWQLVQYQEAFKDDRERLQQIIPAIERMLQNQRYGMLEFQDGIAFLQRRTDSNQVALTAWKAYEQTLKPILEAEE
jgi:uncharacterized membrane protein